MALVATTFAAVLRAGIGMMHSVYAAKAINPQQRDADEAVQSMMRNNILAGVATPEQCRRFLASHREASDFDFLTHQATEICERVLATQEKKEVRVDSYARSFVFGSDGIKYCEKEMLVKPEEKRTENVVGDPDMTPITFGWNILKTGMLLELNQFPSDIALNDKGFSYQGKPILKGKIIQFENGIDNYFLVRRYDGRVYVVKSQELQIREIFDNEYVITIPAGNRLSRKEIVLNDQRDGRSGYFLEDRLKAKKFCEATSE